MPEPNEPQSLNRFSWVRGNPLKFVDPTGQKEEEACSLSDEECEDDEIFWDSDYCSENPESTWCQPSATPTEAVFWFVVGVGGVELAVGVLEVGGIYVLEVLGAASEDGDPTNEIRQLSEPVDELLYKFSEKNGEFRWFLREGEDALSLVRAADFSSPAHAYETIFGRPPGPSATHLVTNVGTALKNGFYPVYDSLAGGLPYGHVSLYGNAWGKACQVIFSVFGSGRPVAP